jgi:hypothetical protein
MALRSACLFGLAIATCIGLSSAPAVAQAGIPFAPLEDTALKDPDNPAKVFRWDFARVEHEFPLSRADRMAITPEMLRGLSQEQIDQIYARLTAGPIPNGQHRGDLFFPQGDSLRARLDEILGGIPGKVAEAKIDLLERIGRTLWKGKVFDREARVLRNMIDDIEPLRALIDDPSGVPTARVRREGLLGRLFPNDTVWLLFPAKLYCGQSLLDGRRESVIIDYGYSDEIADYRASPDSLAGRNGLQIRDEIRMVRPGLYLGRAYAHRMFLLNFVLFDPEEAERGGPAFASGAPIAEDCWPGEQKRREAANQ